MASRSRTQSGQRLSRFVLTLNNYTDAELASYKDAMSTHCSWAILGREQGESGTPHLQGAGVLRKQMSFSTVRSLFPKAHLEIMAGEPMHSLEYCSKEDPEPWQHGNLPTPGKRSDLHVVAELVQKGATLREVAQVHPTAIIKYSRGLSVLRSQLAHQRSPDKPPSVFWIYGTTGTGKTRAAWDYGCATYGEDQTLILPDSTLQWFDLYDGQKCVIIDDFRSKKVNFSFLLRVLDRYPLSVPIKGAYVNWIPECIIITTPLDPQGTFAKRFEHIPEDINQLNRRITACVRLPLASGESFGQLVRNSMPDQSTSLRGQCIRTDPVQSNSRTTGHDVGLQSSLVIDVTDDSDEIIYPSDPMGPNFSWNIEDTQLQCIDCFEFFTELSPQRRCKECGKKTK